MSKPNWKNWGIWGKPARAWEWWRRNCFAVGVVAGLVMLYSIQSDLSAIERQLLRLQFSISNDLGDITRRLSYLRDELRYSN